MVDKLATLKEVIGPFAGLTEDELSVSLPLWRTRRILKGEFYNRQNVVCKDLGIVLKGMFRIYFYDPNADEEKNVYFFRKISSWFHSAVLYFNILAATTSKRLKIRRYYT